MNIKKSELQAFLADMPDVVDADEVMHRVYLLQKIEAGEADIVSGKVVSHADAVERLSQKWRD
ncbi:hypothetical protein [Geomesophilobacter sediminis]|uniref:Uncharacterized protein n=1 Tax=Geomesophilobacter sediminis TaxID=2798584 RepID=A0A8J7JGX9_9BACT|nr:hypothetical protein [Geomesophilobacter sediminis]MBJ6726264.1 hypothetical protein [Geomesophilobacter sediminis]